MNTLPFLLAYSHFNDTNLFVKEFLHTWSECIRLQFALETKIGKTILTEATI